MKPITITIFIKDKPFKAEWLGTCYLCNKTIRANQLIYTTNIGQDLLEFHAKCADKVVIR